MTMPHRSLLRIIVLPFVTAALLLAVETPPGNEELFKALAAYDHSQGSEVPTRINLLVSRASAAQRADLERRLLAVISDVAVKPAAKSVACRQLAMLASGACIPALTPLLVDEELSSQARGVLIALPDPVVLPVLRSALAASHGRTQAGLAGDVGRRGDAASIPLIAKLAADPDPAIAAVARTALGDIGGDEAARILAALPDDVSGSRDDALLRVAEQFAAAKAEAKALAIYRSLSGETHAPLVRLGAWQGLARFETDKIVPALLVLTATSSEKNRVLSQGARSLLADMPEPSVTAAIVSSLNKIEGEGLAGALTVLGLRGDRTTTTTVARFADASQPTAVRLAALTALTDLAGIQEIDLLIRAAQDPEPALRQAAIGTLKRCHGQGVDAELFKRLSTASGTLRDALIQALGDRRGREAVQSLLSLVGQGTAEQSAIIMPLLGKIAEAEDLKPLVALLLTQDGVEATENALAALIKRLPARAQAEGVLLEAQAQIQGQAPSQAQRAVLRLLGLTLTPQALATVVGHTANPDAPTAEVAIRTLATWSEVDALPPLLALAANTSSPLHRTLALRGVLRLCALPGKNAEQKRAVFQQALAAALTQEDCKLVLGGISQSKDPAVLPLLEPLLTNEAVQAEAKMTYLTIVDSLPPAQRIAAWKDLLTKTPDAILRDKIGQWVKAAEEPAPAPR